MGQQGFILSESAHVSTSPQHRGACNNVDNGTNTTYTLSNPIRVKHWIHEEPWGNEDSIRGAETREKAEDFPPPYAKARTEEESDEPQENHTNSSSPSIREDVEDWIISIEITTIDEKHYKVKLVMQDETEVVVENATQKDLEKSVFCIGKEDYPDVGSAGLGHTEYDEIIFHPNGQNLPLWTLMASEDLFDKEEETANSVANGTKTTYTLSSPIRVKHRSREELWNGKDSIKEAWVFSMKIITADGEHYDVDLVFEHEKQFVVSKVTQHDLNQLTFCIRKKDLPDVRVPGIGHTEYDEIAFQKDGHYVSLWTLMACEDFFYKQCT